MTLLKSEDESARTHTHTQPELIYILTETVCPGAVQDGKVREEFDVAMAETPPLLLTEEELKFKS